MAGDWAEIVTGVLIVGATTAAAVAAIKSANAARDSRDLLKWQLHSANVHATIEWGPDKQTFELTIRNDGPSVAYGVYVEVPPPEPGDSGTRQPPDIDSRWHDRFDLVPGDERAIAGIWREHSTKWMKLGFHWTERASDNEERSPPVRWIWFHRASPPAAGRALEH